MAKLIVHLFYVLVLIQFSVKIRRISFGVDLSECQDSGISDPNTQQGESPDPNNANTQQGESPDPNNANTPQGQPPDPPVEPVQGPPPQVNPAPSPSVEQAGDPTLGAGLKGHPKPDTVVIGQGVTQTPPPNPEDIQFPSPSGHSACDESSGDSPIPLGRETKWNTKSGHGATEEMSQKGQRIHTNKFYARLRDKFYMKNDGYNLIFQLNGTAESSQLTMKADHWDDEYVFAKAVLHWGTNDRQGSEHTIHTQRFPLEIQFIHYKLSKGSLKEAAGKDGGVMIASVLYEFSGYDKAYFEPIIKQVPMFSSPGRLKKVHGPLDIKALFPATLEHYEYKGSMTTQPCSSGVKRIVFASPSSIGRDQLKTLRTHLYFEDGITQMTDNFHKLMDKGGKKVIYNPTLHQFEVLLDGDYLTIKPGSVHW